MYSQIWLDLLMDDHHFGYILLSNCQSLLTPPPSWFNSAWDDKPNRDKTTPKRHKKMTQNKTHTNYFVGPGNPRNQTLLLSFGGVVVGALLQHTEYSIAYEWNMHKMASKKFVSNFARKGLQEKQSRMKERKGKEAALLLLLLLPTWDLYTRYENSGKLPPEFASTTKIFNRCIFPGLKKPFLT